jgi:beta-glucosidase
MEISEMLAKLTLEEKVSLLSGQDFWSTTPLPSIGLRSMVVSDGPSGVRGPIWDERDPSLSLPSATAIASTWDTELLKEVGRVMAFEARRKGVDVVLGPTINLHRSPLGGRHFECFSEDPYLSGKLAAGFVQGIQAKGVGATLKHYVANDSETDRYTLNAVVSEKTLRELYLKAFEIAIEDSKPWLVMSAYNSVNGPTMTENPLLDEPLKGEWKFDGVVISDWTAVRTTVDAGNASNDLAMPGPYTPWGAALVAAVNKGKVSMAAIDAKVERLLLMAQRVGGFGAAPKPENLSDEFIQDFARKASSAGAVLLKNSDALPLAKEVSIAVIGGHASAGREQGGGSATVVPVEVITPLAGISAASKAKISYAMGVEADSKLTRFSARNAINTVTKKPGLHIEAFDENGVLIHSEERFAGQLNWMAIDWVFRTKSLKVSLTYTPDEDGKHQFGVGYVGPVTITQDGVKILDTDVLPDNDDIGGAVLNPPEARVDRELKKGVATELVFEFQTGGLDIPVIACNVGFKTPVGTLQQEREKAVAIAKTSDVSVVFVGTTSAIESEGFDRTNLNLPEGQDELVKAVAAVSKKTIVVINAGSPILMPWKNDVDAILLTWFPGQQMGNAVADILFGDAEPGGRLPTTWPEKESDLPVRDVTPVKGILEYKEGSDIGYRAWIKSGNKPSFAFGYGLGYTTWKKELLSNTWSKGLDIEVSVRNSGSRSGSDVVQVYGAPASDPTNKKLLGFAKVFASAGEKKSVNISIAAHSFDFWESGWVRKTGTWKIWIASNALDESLVVNVEVQ